MLRSKYLLESCTANRGTIVLDNMHRLSTNSSNSNNGYANIWGECLRYIIYPAYETFSGRRILKKFEFLEASQWWPYEKLRDYQWQNIQRMVKYAYEKNFYYRRLFMKFGIHPTDIKSYKDFANLPIIRKKDIMENLDDFVSDGFDKNSLKKDMTSGSTGEKLIFYLDQNTCDYRAAADLRSHQWYHREMGEKRFVIWSPMSFDSIIAKISNGCRNILLGDYITSSYQLNEVKLGAIVDEIKKMKPKALSGYVSALTILANFIKARSIEDVKIESIIPTAETLFIHQRDLFEEVFHGRVFNRYGSHEFTGVAHECDHHTGMHINVENVYLEVVEAGRPAAEGQLGELVITDLHNFGMPLIRYGIGDLGALREESCPCGRGLPLLERVEGRVYDVIHCPNGNIQTGTFFCKLIRSVDEIREFQVIQEAKTRIRFRLAMDGELRQHSKHFIEETVKKHCGEEMEIHFELAKTIDPLASGKRRYIISLMESPLNSAY